ncbi:hypothetical protein VB264_16835 [Arcicella aquatica]|uniref:Uncharacterized protein n=1 Tax=Arcicella aquatica TaxID=217141 RepID=A0ABU5QQX0_9BACT|nr:hypothetical protein [Arcicella aquatica]MEA5259468.1 hypothetical protein [Arcicella aquatica]
MKTILIFSCITALSFSFLGSISPAHNQAKPKKDTTFYKVQQISTMRVKLDSIEKYSEGLCDTCVAAFRGAIVENRILARRISEQNFEMQKLIQKNDSLLKGDITKNEL